MKSILLVAQKVVSVINNFLIDDRLKEFVGDTKEADASILGRGFLCILEEKAAS